MPACVVWCGRVVLSVVWPRGCECVTYEMLQRVRSHVPCTKKATPPALALAVLCITVTSVRLTRVSPNSMAPASFSAELYRNWESAMATAGKARWEKVGVGEG